MPFNTSAGANSCCCFSLLQLTERSSRTVYDIGCTKLRALPSGRIENHRRVFVQKSAGQPRCLYGGLQLRYHDVECVVVGFNSLGMGLHLGSAPRLPLSM